MIYIFLSGALGFFVFDVYRIYSTYARTNRLEITFGKILGIFIHILVYTACGLIGLFINLDILGICCDWHLFPPVNDHLVAPMMRSFALGLAGPSGLTKGKVNIQDLTKNGVQDFGDLQSASNTFTFTKIRAYLGVLFMR